MPVITSLEVVAMCLEAGRREFALLLSSQTLRSPGSEHAQALNPHNPVPMCSVDGYRMCGGVVAGSKTNSRTATPRVSTIICYEGCCMNTVFLLFRDAFKQEC